jgi:hypothetical protein
VKSILPTDFPSLGVPWLIEAATALYGKAKVADRIPQVANVVISNVPGPPMPLYMAGARMLTNYPTSIVVHGMALNITVQSYDQSLDFGLMADAKAMPDVQDFARAIEIAFDDLRALPLPHEPADAAESAADLMGRAARSVSRAVSGAMTDAVRGAMNSAAKTAVNAAFKSAVTTATVGRAARALPKAAAKPAPSRTRRARLP